MRSLLLSLLFIICSATLFAQNCDELIFEDFIYACQGEVIEINASCDDANGYVWYKDGEILINETFDFLTVTESGDYTVDIGYTEGIVVYHTTVVFAIEPTVTFSSFVNGNVFCQGESVDITATTSFCNTTFDEETFLPDGNGESYSFFIDVSCFAADAVLESITDLEALCLNMEHSFFGDLEMELISPNGSSIILHANAGGGNFLGEPIDIDSDISPGIGYEYCFRADADVLLVDGELVYVYTQGDQGYSIVGGSYLPEQDFSQLVGTPLNGTWEVRITDNLAADNGYLFSADLQFNTDLYLSDAENGIPNIIVSQEWEPNATIIATMDNVITVQPNAAGEFCYDFTVEDDFGCFYTDTVCITIDEGAIACDPEALVVCDEDNDGFTQFDLTVADSSILCGNLPEELVVTYHESLSDAENGFSDLSSPYTNITPNIQTVFARLFNLNTQCYDVVDLELIVVEAPTANQAPDLSLIDNDGDGVEIFDLTVNEVIIIGGDPAVTLNYFETLADSQANVNPIANPTSYVSPTRTIYVRVENVQTGCVNLTTFNIIVEMLTPVDSDDDGIPDTDEDVNGNNDLEDDDTDDDGVPNYLDPDDDGDSVPTAVEIEGEGAGLGPLDFIDTDEDDIENYLDNDDDGDGALTIDEDYNNNGTPLDDDTDDSGTPDFLEFNVNLGIANTTFGNVTLFPNPAEDEVLVSWEESTLITTLNVFNIQGNLIRQMNDFNNVSEAKINLDDLATGVYFVQLVSNEGAVTTRKLIKK